MQAVFSVAINMLNVAASEGKATVYGAIGSGTNSLGLSGVTYLGQSYALRLQGTGFGASSQLPGNAVVQVWTYWVWTGAAANHNALTDFSKLIQPGGVVSSGGQGGYRLAATLTGGNYVAGHNYYGLGLQSEGLPKLYGVAAEWAGALSGNDIITGSAGNDTLAGYDGNDSINGGAGNDVIFGGAGADTLVGGGGVDTLRGGSGNDVYIVSQTGSVVDESGGSGIDVVQASVTWSLKDSLVENLTLTGSGNINGTGSQLNNSITGNLGINVLSGGDGDDTLNGGGGGGGGADTLIGGAGRDVYIVNSVATVLTETVVGPSEVDTVVSSVTWTLGNNFEILNLSGTAAINGTGNALANTVTGNAAANVLNGGAGADTLVGGDGSDTYVVDNVRDEIREQSGQPGNIDTVQSTVSWTLGNGLENLVLTGQGQINGTGNDAANVITGNGASNVLSGGNGNDTLNGGGGPDTLIGGDGNDTYVVDNVRDIVQEGGNGLDADSVLSSVTWTLGANVENLTFTGAVAVNGTGNSLNNVLAGNAAANYLSGGAGTDTLIGGGGDTLNGGSGGDTYIVSATNVVIVEAVSALDQPEFDTVQANVSFLLPSNTESLELTGSANINGTGNALDNILVGNKGNNVLNGGRGSDLISGGDGNDTLIGGGGSDIFLFDSPLSTIKNVDVILQFNVASDVIILDQNIMSGLPDEFGNGTLETFWGSDSNLGVKPQVFASAAATRVIFDPVAGGLYYDADGNGGRYTPVKFAELTFIGVFQGSDYQALTSANFVVMPAM